MKPKNTDDYISMFPADVQKKLTEIRTTIKKAVPDAEEVISYNMPAFKQIKVLVYFAANKNHIGFYPTSSPIKFFKEELSSYQTSKGAIQFPYNRPLPKSLIKKIVTFRIKEVEEKFNKKPEVSGKKEIKKYNQSLKGSDKKICDLLEKEISINLPEADCKIWHRHPVWFIEGNPVAGYHKLKDCIRLLFWSGQSFEEPGLKPEGSFKAAEARFNKTEEVDIKKLKRWLKKAVKIQWDYKNIVKRRGVLEKITNF